VKTIQITQAQLNNMLAAQRREYETKIAAAQVELGKRQSEQHEFEDRCKSLGIVPNEGESLEDAAQRWIADAESRLAAPVAVESDHSDILARAEAAESKLFDLMTESEIRRAAPDAFNVDQITSIIKSHTRQLPNGELTVVDLVPTALQSVSEATDYLRVSQPNLFVGPDGRPAQS
jgi:hypothetical protein